MLWLPGSRIRVWENQSPSSCYHDVRSGLPNNLNYLICPRACRLISIMCLRVGRREAGDPVVGFV